MTRTARVTGKPITHERLHQRVVEELLKQIVSGAIPPGTVESLSLDAACLPAMFSQVLRRRHIAHE